MNSTNEITGLLATFAGVAAKKEGGNILLSADSESKALAVVGKLLAGGVIDNVTGVCAVPDSGAVDTRYLSNQERERVLANAGNPRKLAFGTVGSEWKGDRYTGKPVQTFVPATPESDVFYDAAKGTLTINAAKIKVAALIPKK